MRLSYLSDVIQNILKINGDCEVFVSQGDYSDQMITIDSYTFCRREDGKWVKCFAESCTREKRQGVLII